MCPNGILFPPSTSAFFSLHAHGHADPCGAPTHDDVDDTVWSSAPLREPFAFLVLFYGFGHIFFFVLFLG